MPRASSNKPQPAPKKPPTPVDDTHLPNRVIALDLIDDHPENYNLHPEEQLEILAESDHYFGQVRSIVVQEHPDSPGRYLLVAGHGYTQARREEHQGTIKADVIPAHWSALKVKAYLIADNETSRKARLDEDRLHLLLQEQHQANTNLKALGFTEEDYQDRLDAMAPPSLDRVVSQFGEGDIRPEALLAHVHLQITHDVKERLESLMDRAPGSSDSLKLLAVLSCVDMAALAGYQHVVASPASAPAYPWEDEGEDTAWAPADMDEDDE